MRAVVAGVGLRAAHVLTIFKEQMPELVFDGYVDPQPGFLDAIGTDTPAFETVEEMLAATDPELFFIFSPNGYHLDHIRAGLQAGVRMFAEKPIVTTEDESFALAELLAEYGSDQVMVGLVLRYSQHMVDLRASLDVLGPIASIEASEYIAPYHGAFFMRDWRRKEGLSGGFMLEKCCHDLDIYNMIMGARPMQVASFGGNRSFLPEHAPTSNAEAQIMHQKASIWESADDPFSSDADIIDFQTAMVQYENGAALSFHTSLNVPDEHRRFCVLGALGMAEGDFVRGGLKITARDGTTVQEFDYTQMAKERRSAHYGADHMMVAEVVEYLQGRSAALKVGVLDALEAGLLALAIDRARKTGQVVSMADIWARYDSYGLRG